MIFSIIVALVIVEIFLRLIHFKYRPLRVICLRKGDWRLKHSFEDKNYVYDPDLIWKPDVRSSAFNSYGYKGREITPETTCRVFAYGDSNTLGWAVKDYPNWPMYLDRLVAKDSNKCIIVNTACEGYTSFQILGRFKESLKYNPKIAIISGGGNDSHKVTIPDSQFHRKDVIRVILDRHLIRFKTGQLIIAFLDSFQKNEKNLVARVSLEEYRHNLEEIIKIAKEKNIKLVLLTRPFIGKSNDPDWWKTYAPLYNKMTVEIARENNIPVIDIYMHFDGKLQYFRKNDESHFNEKGHKKAALLIYQKIRKDLEDDLE